jgi:biotin transport system substrate-specific component
MSSVTSVSPRTLADVVPGGLVRSIALVIGGAIFVGLTAQVSIPLPFTPVPLTLQTFSVAAWLVGWLAERGADRRVVPTIGMMALGNLVIYVFGIAGLMVLADMSFGKALTLGVLPFLIGDAIKMLLAAVLLPGTWKLINSRRSS